MSHEIRTPLMGVVGMLEILSRTSLTDEQRRIIATANESSSALKHIVDDVLDFAKLESARAGLSPVATDLADLLEGCTETLANQADTKGLRITCEVDFNMPPVMCDAARLRQVLLNIGINAVKFTDSGHVELRLQAGPVTNKGTAVRFTIADSGIGIPADFHAFLFQPFSQLAVSAGRGHAGVGLGLAICRTLVEAMEGSITVESAPGRGTRFFIDLTFPPAPGPTWVPPDLEALSVIVLDDGEPSLQIAVRYLEAAGAKARRVGALNSLGANSLLSIFPLPAGEGNVLVLIGPDAEAEDVQAATTTLNTGAAAKPPVLWLHPRAVGGAQILARRGVRAVRAHPLRRAQLFVAVGSAHPSIADYAGTPVLTRRLDAQTVSGDDEEAAAAARAEGRVILIAEDNAVNQLVLRQQLAILGFDCDIAGNGVLALQALRERAYLLLLCDCHMPGTDGFELTRLIRLGEKSGGRRLPIIAITANAMPGEPERCRAAGMDDYLSKPIEISGLKTALERWLDVARHPVRLSTADPAPSAAATSAIDLKNLKAVFGNDAGRLKPILDQWRAVIEQASADLRTALAGEKWSEAGAAAHRIKGSAGIAGAHGLSAAAAALEDALHMREPARIAREGQCVLTCAAGALQDVHVWAEAAGRKAAAQS